MSSTRPQSKGTQRLKYKIVQKAFLLKRKEKLLKLLLEKLHEFAKSSSEHLEEHT